MNKKVTYSLVGFMYVLKLIILFSIKCFLYDLDSSAWPISTPKLSVDIQLTEMSILHHFKCRKNVPVYFLRGRSAEASEFQPNKMKNIEPFTHKMYRLKRSVPCKRCT